MRIFKSRSVCRFKRQERLVNARVCWFNQFIYKLQPNHRVAHIELTIKCETLTLICPAAYKHTHTHMRIAAAMRTSHTARRQLSVNLIKQKSIYLVVVYFRKRSAVESYMPRSDNVNNHMFRLFDAVLNAVLSVSLLFFWESQSEACEWCDW